MSGDWPAEDTESLGACPLCGSAARALEHAALQDRIFFAAPGTWRMWRCAACGLGYLDPQPAPGAIGRAYAAYYTHDQKLPERRGEAPRALGARIRRAVVHDYLNACFGYRLRPALPFSRFAFGAFPAKARDAAEMVRHLPAPKPGGRLLDIGCGNGIFLILARDLLGYEVEGTEIDEVAAAKGRERGIAIHPVMLPGTGLPPGRFAQVTLNHVLEHVFDPVAALREVFSLLAPGGRVWVQVPNLRGASHVRFGADSRLLEPPRHLTMFTPATLRTAFEAAGLTRIARLPVQNPAPAMFEMSWRIAQRIDPYAPSPAPPAEVMAAGLEAARRHSGIADEAEVMTMIGFRPADG